MSIIDDNEIVSKAIEETLNTCNPSILHTKNIKHDYYFLLVNGFIPFSNEFSSNLYFYIIYGFNNIDIVSLMENEYLEEIIKKN